MIQSSPHSHAAEALLGEPGVRPSSGKAKRNGLASLFSSLLAEARSAAETAAAGQGKSKAPSKTAQDGVAAAPSLAQDRSARGAERGAAFGRLESAERGSRGAGKAAAAEGAVKPRETPVPGAEALAIAAPAGKPAQAAKNASSLGASAGEAEAEILGSPKDVAGRRKATGRGTGEAGELGSGTDGASQLAALTQRNSGALKRPADGASAEPRESKAEAAETKKKDKRKERLEIELYDHRSPSAPAADAAAVAKGEMPAAGDRKGAAEAELVVNLRAGNAERGGDEASRPSAAPTTSFSDALARELRENANADIVKHASLVLKDGGEGLLRLSLKPDTLGAVKIRLEMADNRIAGRILVESDEALKAFEKELASLEQAFRDGGFDGASLELAVSADGARGGGQGNGGDGPRPFFSERLASSTYEEAAVSVNGNPASAPAESLVNVLV